MGSRLQEIATRYQDGARRVEARRTEWRERTAKVLRAAMEAAREEMAAGGLASDVLDPFDAGVTPELALRLERVDLGRVRITAALTDYRFEEPASITFRQRVDGLVECEAIGHELDHREMPGLFDEVFEPTELNAPRVRELLERWLEGALATSFRAEPPPVVGVPIDDEPEERPRGFG